MQLVETKELALALMARHGLQAWRFDFDGAKRRLGACWLHRQEITLSRHFVELNELAQVRDVILHEIAHALTPGDGHGRKFKQKARELGCNPAACVPAAQVKAPPARYRLQCPHCGRTWQRYRRPATNLSCGSCLRSKQSMVLPLKVSPEHDFGNS